VLHALAEVKRRTLGEWADAYQASRVDYAAETISKQHRLLLRVLEQTGMRVGELQGLAWGDVDEASNRFLIRSGKTATARRCVAVPDSLMLEVAVTVPREDRTAERIVFPGFTGSAAKNAMARACKGPGSCTGIRTTCGTATRR
jgi:integrase